MTRTAQRTRTARAGAWTSYRAGLHVALGVSHSPTPTAGCRLWERRSPLCLHGRARHVVGGAAGVGVRWSLRLREGRSDFAE
jgi:hypothetical protein